MPIKNTTAFTSNASNTMYVSYAHFNCNKGVSKKFEKKKKLGDFNSNLTLYFIMLSANILNFVYSI